MTDIVMRLRENADLDAAEHVPHEVVQMQYDAADCIERLRAQVAHLSLYKPARRTEQQQEPVKAIGECNEPFWFGGIVETDLQPQKQIIQRPQTRVKPRLLFCIRGIYRSFCSCLVNFSPTSILRIL